MRPHPLKTLTAAGAALTSFGGPALAQTVPASELHAVDEVVVTASRRPQAVEQLGSSVTIISAETIEQQ